MVRVFKDIYSKNTATINSIMILPYAGAYEEHESYVLSLTADYNGSFLYHRSVHETETDAFNKMCNCTCGEWEEIGVPDSYPDTNISDAEIVMLVDRKSA